MLFPFENELLTHVATPEKRGQNATAGPAPSCRLSIPELPEPKILRNIAWERPKAKSAHKFRAAKKRGDSLLQAGVRSDCDLLAFFLRFDLFYLLCAAPQVLRPMVY